MNFGKNAIDGIIGIANGQERGKKSKISACGIE